MKTFLYGATAAAAFSLQASVAQAARTMPSAIQSLASSPQYHMHAPSYEAQEANIASVLLATTLVSFAVLAVHVLKDVFNPSADREPVAGPGLDGHPYNQKLLQKKIDENTAEGTLLLAKADSFNPIKSIRAVHLNSFDSVDSGSSSGSLGTIGSLLGSQNSV